MTQSLFDSAQFNMFQILLFFGILVNANAQTVWTYNNQNGWPNDKCKSGSKQSPIEINPLETDFEMAVMEPFIFENYEQMPKSSRLTNTGQLIEADFIFDKPVMVRIIILTLLKIIFTIILDQRRRTEGERWIQVG